MNPSIERIRELLEYHPETGVLSWRVKRGNATAGAEAGTMRPDGYRVVRVDDKFCRAHRVAWAIANGAWPTGEIDHLNGVHWDNRLANLRDVTRQVNQQNQKRARSDSRSGSSVPGVRWRKRDRRFIALAKRDGKKIHIGSFKTMSEAESASLAYRREHYEGFTL